MKNFFYKFGLVFQDAVLRKRIFFTIAALALFRVLSVIPIPGVNATALSTLFANNDLLGLLNVITGGGLAQLSIVMLGVGPYITASIIMQLATVMFPRLKEMYQEEGEIGRRKFAQWSRVLAIPLGFIQGFTFLRILQTQGIFTALTPFGFAVDLIVVTAGSILLMWIGELITEYGIGNGLSIIIFAGIMSGALGHVGQLAYLFNPAQIPLYLVILLIGIAVIVGVVVITEAERPIPITYAKQVRGNRVYGGSSTYLPLRLNQSGVIPIIFAVSILQFPLAIARFLATSANTTIASIAAWVSNTLANLWIYGIVYFLLVFIFTYFYTAVTFDPDQISTNLQKNGAFVPGVRPGQSTADHISKILVRLTLFGALFLGIIAVLPIAVQSFTGITAISVGGTALLIVVSVVIDVIKKIDAQVSIREY